MDLNEYESEEDYIEKTGKEVKKSGNLKKTASKKTTSNKKSNNRSSNDIPNRELNSDGIVNNPNLYEDIDLNEINDSFRMDKRDINILNLYIDFYKESIKDIILNDVRNEILTNNKNITKVKIFARLLLIIQDNFINSVMVKKLIPYAYNNGDSYYIKKIVKVSRYNKRKAKSLLSKYLSRSGSKINLKSFDIIRFLNLNYMGLLNGKDFYNFIIGYKDMYLNLDKDYVDIHKDIERILLSNIINRLNKIDIIEINEMGCTLDDVRNESIFYKVGNEKSYSELDKVIALCLESVRVRKGLSKKSVDIKNKKVSNAGVVSKTEGNDKGKGNDEGKALDKPVKNEDKSIKENKIREDLTKAEKRDLEDFIVIYRREILNTEKIRMDVSFGILQYHMDKEEKSNKSNDDVKEDDLKFKPIKNMDKVKVIYLNLCEIIHGFYMEQSINYMRGKSYDKQYMKEVLKSFNKTVPNRYKLLSDYAKNYGLIIDENIDTFRKIDGLIENTFSDIDDESELINTFSELYKSYVGVGIKESLNNVVSDFIDYLMKIDFGKLKYYGSSILDKLDDKESLFKCEDIDKEIVTSIYKKNESTFVKLLKKEYINLSEKEETVKINKYQNMLYILNSHGGNINFLEKPEIFSVMVKFKNNEMVLVNIDLIVNLLNMEVYYDKNGIVGETFKLEGIDSCVKLNSLELKFLRILRRSLSSNFIDVPQSADDFRRLKRFAFICHGENSTLNSYKMEVVSVAEKEDNGVFIGVKFLDRDGKLRKYKLTTMYLKDLTDNKILYRRRLSDSIIKDFLDFAKRGSKNGLKFSLEQHNIFWSILEYSFDLRRSLEDGDGNSL